jgi:hypothetical protein
MPATTCSTTLVARKSQGLILATQWYKPSSGTSHAVVQAIQWHWPRSGTSHPVVIPSASATSTAAG